MKSTTVERWKDVYPYLITICFSFKFIKLNIRMWENHMQLNLKRTITIICSSFTISSLWDRSWACDASVWPRANKGQKGCDPSSSHTPYPASYHYYQANLKKCQGWKTSLLLSIKCKIVIKINDKNNISFVVGNLNFIEWLFLLIPESACSWDHIYHTCLFLYHLICWCSGYCCHFESPIQKCHLSTESWACVA